MTNENNKVSFTSFEEILDTLIDGISNAYKECPDADNKTFEEIAEWAGQHVLLTEETNE
jgi:predicted transcriptional regulator